MRASRMYMDLVIIILMMVCACYFLPTLVNEINNPSVRFYEDKTALDAENAIDIDSTLYRYDTTDGKFYVEIDGATIGLMLLLQDEFSQDPKKVRIGNSYYVEFNENWPGSKFDTMNKDYATQIKPYMNSRTKKFIYVYPGYAPGVNDSYFWYVF